MAVFQHPHLTRGVVQTPRGAFVISRGFVSAPDDIGDALGWRRVDGEGHMQDASPSTGRHDASASPATMPLDRR